LPKELKGGWRIFRKKDGTVEKRFIPLTVKETAHCKSCLYFRKGYGGRCILDPNIFTSPDAEACNNYVNRNIRRTRI
jgi:hypothetical protein